jgi:hypothetical protein
LQITVEIVMKFKFLRFGVTAAVALTFFSGSAFSAQCGNSAGGFAAWKAAFAQQAKAGGHDLRRSPSKEFQTLFVGLYGQARSILDRIARA